MELCNSKQQTLAGGPFAKDFLFMSIASKFAGCLCKASVVRGIDGNLNCEVNLRVLRRKARV